MKRRKLEIYDDARIVAERHREKGREEGAAEERAKIVAYLRSASNGSETVKYGNLFADEINAKEHLK